VMMSGTLARSDGVQRLYFPAFDTPATHHGIAQGLDGERLGEFFSQLTAKGFTVTGAYGRRQRDVPTASFNTAFNQQRSPEQTTDRHVLADVEYGRALGMGHLTVRAGFDQFSYQGNYPLDAGDGTVAFARNLVLGSRLTASTRLTRPLPRKQVLTVGAEFIDNLNQNQSAEYIDPPDPLFVDNRASTQNAAFVQDEIRVTPWLIANGGLRYDRYEDFQRVTPRAALIVMPSSNQSFKYLYGRAFRAPNLFERNAFYYGAGTENLRPESIDTHEFVWERYTGDRLRTSVSAYRYNASGLITLVPDPATFFLTTFVNQGRVRASGLELEAQMRLPGDIQSVVSYALQDAENADTSVRLVNSPAQMAKARLSVPGPWKGSFASVEVLSMGSRRTISGATLGAATTANLTLIAPLRPGLELIGTARNLFDVQYSDPVSDEHRQDAIPQNGRTLRIGVRWTPGAR
jgi:outer membrane receptor for ferrienterochelin and colicins